jgi:hypothetical protein
MVSKYNSLKFLKETKARVLHFCDNCDQEIQKGEIYYRESIGMVNAPGIKLKKYCNNCNEKHGDKLLAR